MENKQEIDIISDSSEATLYNLVSIYGDELKRIAFLYLNDMALSEDIVQEVFISCYNNLHKFNHRSTYRTWLYRITINKCKDFQKKWSYRNIVYKPFVESLIMKPVDPVHKTYESHHEQNEIISAISFLPQKYKEVLIFYYYQEMSMKEISTITNVKINTVKSRINRGRSALKEELERRGYNYE